MVMVLVMTRGEGELVVLGVVVLAVVDAVDAAVEVSLVEGVVVLVSDVSVLDVGVIVTVEDGVALVDVAGVDDVVLDGDLLDVESVVRTSDITDEMTCRLTFSSAPTTAIARRKAESRKSEEADEHRILGTSGAERQRARWSRLFQSAPGCHREDRGEQRK